MRTRIVATLPQHRGGRLRYGSLATPFVFNDPDNRQLVEPIRATGYYERELNNAAADDHMVWLFRNRVVVVEPPYEFSLAEIALAVKHTVIECDDTFAEMQCDVERFERLAKCSGTPRDPIPKEVRLFVWQRDGGKCVECGSNERIEFDHVIPLAKGGSNTERNIRVLCEKCNRAKGAAIA